MDGGEFFAVMVVIAVVFLAGFLIGQNSGENNFTKRLIRNGIAVYRADMSNGEAKVMYFRGTNEVELIKEYQ